MFLCGWGGMSGHLLVCVCGSKGESGLSYFWQKYRGV